MHRALVTVECSRRENDHLQGDVWWWAHALFSVNYLKWKGKLEKDYQEIGVLWDPVFWGEIPKRKSRIKGKREERGRNRKGERRRKTEGREGEIRGADEYPKRKNRNKWFGIPDQVLKNIILRILKSKKGLKLYSKTLSFK